MHSRGEALRLRAGRSCAGQRTRRRRRGVTRDRVPRDSVCRGCKYVTSVRGDLGISK